MNRELELKEKKEILNDKGETTYSCKVYVPDVDIYEDDKNIFLEADMPGVKKEDLKLNLENSVLTIDGQVSKDEYKNNLNPLYGEYNIGHFQREFKIGSAVAQKDINASLKNGVLTIKLPKSERAKPRQIEVK